MKKIATLFAAFIVSAGVGLIGAGVGVIGALIYNGTASLVNASGDMSLPFTAAFIGGMAMILTFGLLVTSDDEK